MTVMGPFQSMQYRDILISFIWKEDFIADRFFPDENVVSTFRFNFDRNFSGPQHHLESVNTNHSPPGQSIYHDEQSDIR